MAYEIPTTEPTSARAGDTWQWVRTDLSDYPASTWSLVYHFRNATDYFDVSASADGDTFAVDVDPATTGPIAAGRYDWFAFVSAAGERYQIDAGAITVLADVASAAAFDARGWSRRMLDYVEAALENRATEDQLDLINATIADRGFTRDRAGLLTLRSQLETEVKRAEGTGGKLQRIVTRFN